MLRINFCCIFITLISKSYRVNCCRVSKADIESRHHVFFKWKTEEKKRTRLERAFLLFEWSCGPLQSSVLYNEFCRQLFFVVNAVSGGFSSMNVCNTIFSWKSMFDFFCFLLHSSLKVKINCACVCVCVYVCVRTRL